MHPKDVQEGCRAAADYATRAKAQTHAHVQESVQLYGAIRRAHGTAALPKPAMDCNHLGQLVHQQVRACATRFNAYTRHNGTYTNADCQDRVETNMHVIAQCPRYAAARESFSRVTRVEF